MKELMSWIEDIVAAVGVIALPFVLLHLGYWLFG